MASQYGPGVTPAKYPVLNLKPGAKWSKGLTSGHLDTFDEWLLGKLGATPLTVVHI